jgi:hypothetical protein
MNLKFIEARIVTLRFRLGAKGLFEKNTTGHKDRLYIRKNN